MAEETQEREEEKSTSNKYSLPYGIAKGLGLSTEGMTPSQVWAMLSGYGYSAKHEYEKLDEKFGAPEKHKIDKKKDFVEIDAATGTPKNSTEEKVNALTEEEVNEIYQEEDSEKFSAERKNKAVWCKSSEESEKVFGSQSNKVYNNLTQNEKAAVYDYTAGSGKFNRPLRGYLGGWGKEHYVGAGLVDLNSEGAEQEIKNLTEAINQSSYDFDTWVQRGTDFDGAKQLLGIFGKITQDKINSIVASKEEFTDKGFFSCGAAKGTGFSGNVIFNIYAPKGTKMLFVGKKSAFKYENEIIIQRGSTFRVTKGENKNGQWFIDLEVVGQ